MNMRMIATVCCMAFLLTSVQGGHIIGGELYYSCDGQENFSFTMNLYRDCAGTGAQFDSTPGSTTGRVTIYRGSSTDVFQSIILPAPEVTEVDLTTGNPCLNAPSNLCLQQGVYFFNAVLPLSDEPYHVVYQRCCRNPTINNLVDPGDAGGTYAVEITPYAQEVCNSSPRFIGLPPPVICLDELLNYDHSAFDIDGDSLVYEFCTPYGGGTSQSPVPNPSLPPPWNPLTFATPYSFDNPMGGLPRVDLNEDGMIEGIPSIGGQFVVTVCASEYRDGVLLSTIRREFQFNVTDCIPFIQAQIVSDALEFDTYILQSCNDLDIMFNDISFPSQNIESYSWEVLMSEDSLFEWNIPNNLVTFPSPGDYNGLLIINPDSQCSDTANFKVVITPEMLPGFTKEADICEESEIEFSPLLLPPTVESLSWSFGNGLTSVETTPIVQFEEPGNYIIDLDFIDTIGCQETYTDTLAYFPIDENWSIALDSTTDLTCPPVDFFFTIDSDFITDAYTVDWNTGDNTTGEGYDYQHRYNRAGVFDVNVTILSPTGCQDSKNYPAFVDLPFGLFIPNIFMPDAPGVNGNFCIQSLCPLTNFDLKVFDRYGNIVFESVDRDACWDGYIDGRLAQAGVYAYALKYNDEFAEENYIGGDITIVY